jgi:hypothetical protein
MYNFTCYFRMIMCSFRIYLFIKIIYIYIYSRNDIFMWHSPNDLRMGMLQYGIRALVFNTEPRWVVSEIEEKFHRELKL